MNDELLKYYNRELAYIRHMGADFADKYPKIAGRLKLSEEQIEDPHVSRLVESFAFMTAQIRQKLDDSFPELTDALMGQLYPDYQAPIPSMSVIKMTTENLSTTGIVLPRGSDVESDVEGMKTCHFRTCYDSYLWPVEVNNAQFNNAPFSAPRPIWSTTAKSVVKIELQGEYKEVGLKETELNKLRFYINGQWHHSLSIYELLFKSAIGFAIEAEGHEAKFFSTRHLLEVGFSDQHATIPYSDKSATGYRLLAENFIFPEKFLFFDLEDINQFLPEDKANCNLYIYFDESSQELEKQLGKQHFQLGCTPIVNLFEQELEPVRVSLSQYEYKLVPRYMDADISEVIQVGEVNAYDHKDNSYQVTPFYGQTHPAYRDQDQLFWHIRRESAYWAGGFTEQGTDTFFSLVDREFEHFEPDSEHESWLVTIKALCSNRNLPANLPFGGDEPQMLVPERADIIKKVRCLVAPTHAVRPELSDATRWQLVSHLSLDYFSGPDALRKLKETLRLYDFKNAPESKALIDNIHGINIEMTSARLVQGGRTCFASGSAITLTFAKDDFSGSGMFFFASVLDHFFAQFAAINSFTQLRIRFKDQDSIYHSWPPRSGKVPLL